MKIHSFACWLSVLALTATTPVVFAETTPNAPLDEVSVEFSIMAWKRGIPRLEYTPSSEDSVETVEALEGSERSQVHHYTGAANVPFYLVGHAPRRTTRLQMSRKSASSKRLFASVSFPTGATRFTVLVLGEDHQNRMYPIAENGDLLPPNFIRLHNFTDYNLAITYNEGDGVQIASQGTAYIRLDQTAVVIHVSCEEDGQWRRVSNNVIELNEQSRANLIFASGEGRSVQLYTLPPWPKY
jgi:hypothetical protein